MKDHRPLTLGLLLSGLVASFACNAPVPTQTVPTPYLAPTQAPNTPPPTAMPPPPPDPTATTGPGTIRGVVWHEVCEYTGGEAGEELVLGRGCVQWGDESWEFGPNQVYDSFETGWEGVTAGRTIPKHGQRTSNTAAVNLKNVRVPKENMIAAPGKGFVLAMRTFARTRPSIGAFAVGAARSAMEFALDYAQKRRAFGAKIGDFQAIQFKIAEMYQQVETARLLIWKAAWEADQGRDPNISASIAKLYATEAAFGVVDQALQIMGGYGYTRFFPVEKLLRDTRLFRIYEGTSEVQRVILAGHAMSSYEPVMPPLEDLPIAYDRDFSEAERQAAGAVYRCRMCGYVHYGDQPPDACPYCFYPAAAFKRVETR